MLRLSIISNISKVHYPLKFKNFLPYTIDSCSSNILTVNLVILLHLVKRGPSESLCSPSPKKRKLSMGSYLSSPCSHQGSSLLHHDTLDYTGQGDGSVHERLAEAERIITEQVFFLSIFSSIHSVSQYNFKAKSCAWSWDQWYPEPVHIGQLKWPLTQKLWKIVVGGGWHEWKG